MTLDAQHASVPFLRQQVDDHGQVFGSASLHHLLT